MAIRIEPRTNAAERAAEIQTRVRDWVADLGRRRTIIIPIDDATKRRPYPRINARGRVVRDVRKGRRAAQPTNAQVMRYFVEDRNFLDINAFARDYIRREAYARILQSGRASLPTGQQIGFYVGAAWKALVLERFTNSGYDLNPRPLSWSWAERKHQLNLHPGIGRASDQLLVAIKRAQIVVRAM